MDEQASQHTFRKSLFYLFDLYLVILMVVEMFVLFHVSHTKL